MSVLIETLDVSKMSKNGRPVSEYHTSIPAGVKNAAVTFSSPTGKEPICVVNCDKNNKEADIYIIREHTYLPVYVAPGVEQILTSDENQDDFPMQRIATLTPAARSFPLEIRRNGEKTGRWINFFLED
jgi:hypothetical protein